MTLFKNYLDKLLQANTDADAIAPVALGGSVTSVGTIATTLDNELNYALSDFTGAAVVGTDLAIAEGGLGLDVLSDGLFAITVVGYFSWGETPVGNELQVLTTGPFATYLPIGGSYPALANFAATPILPLLEGDSIALQSYVDGGSQATPTLHVLTFVAVKIGPLPA